MKVLRGQPVGRNKVLLPGKEVGRPRQVTSPAGTPGSRLVQREFGAVRALGRGLREGGFLIKL